MHHQNIACQLDTATGSKNRFGICTTCEQSIGCRGHAGGDWYAQNRIRGRAKRNRTVHEGDGGEQVMLHLQVQAAREEVADDTAPIR